MMNEGISVADALALRNTGYDGGNGFGGDGAWWVVILILLFAANGWGNNNGFGGNGGGAGGYSACCTPATAQGLSDAFNFNQLDNATRSIANGLCDGFYTTNMNLNTLGQSLQECCCQTQLGMANGFNGVTQSIMQNGFQNQQCCCDIEQAIMQNSFNNQSGFNAVNTAIAAAACDNSHGQESIKYAIANATNELLVANDRNTDRIINHLVQTELDKLRTDLQTANFQLSQQAQTANIVNQLMPVAKPAYLTCSPYASAFGFGGYGCGTNYNSGCGCCA